MLALDETSRVWSWGKGTEGQLGHGVFETSYNPQRIEGLIGITMVACGSAHSMVANPTTLYTFGWNEHGNLADGTTSDRSQPVEIQGFFENRRILSINCGGASSLVIAAH